MTDQCEDKPGVEIADTELRASIKDRVDAGLKQTAIATAAGISNALITRFISGERTLSPETRRKVIAAIDNITKRFAGRGSPNSYVPLRDEINVDDLIAMKLQADFDRSAISSPAQLLTAKQEFVKRTEIITSIPEFRLVESIGGLRGFDPFRKELEGMIEANEKTDEWPSDLLRQDVQILKNYTKYNGPLRANCNIQLGPLATMYALIKYCEIDIDIEVKHASGVEMVRDITKQIDTRPFDFIACTTGAFNLALVGKNRITDYQPIIAICCEDHEFLCNARRSQGSIPKLRVVLTYGYSASDENTYVSQSRGELRDIEVERKDQISTLVRLCSQLDEATAINLWVPLTVVLRKRFGWVKATASPYQSQIVLYQHKRFSLRSLLPVSHAFRRLYVQQWNWLRKQRRREAPWLFYGNDALKLQFCRGAGLDVLPDLTP